MAPTSLCANCTQDFTLSNLSLLFPCLPVAVLGIAEKGMSEHGFHSQRKVKGTLRFMKSHQFSLSPFQVFISQAALGKPRPVQAMIWILLSSTGTCLEPQVFTLPPLPTSSEMKGHPLMAAYVFLYPQRTSFSKLQKTSFLFICCT